MYLLPINVHDLDDVFFVFQEAIARISEAQLSSQSSRRGRTGPVLWAMVGWPLVIEHNNSIYGALQCIDDAPIRLGDVQ